MPVIVLGMCVLALAFRMTLGVDMADEAYYISFIHGWLRSGLGHSPNLLIHQTAELVVYPLAVAYTSIVKNEVGLVLFLRFVYLALALSASLHLYQAVRLKRSQLAATLTAAFALLFIPFGLPAPSYNTLGMYATLAALSLFAVLVTRHASGTFNALKGRGMSRELWLSAFWWAVACVAYPTMFLTLLTLLSGALMVMRSPDDRRLVWLYSFVCAAVLAIAALLTCMALGPTQLWKMVLFTNSINTVSHGLTSKLQSIVGVFVSHPYFTALCFAAAVLSGLRCLVRLQNCIALDLGIGLLIVLVASSPEVTLYVRSHDLVLILMLLGLGLVVRQLADRNAKSTDAVFPLIFCASVVGGLVTVATSLNGLMNFPIGGLASACISLGMLIPATNAAGKFGWPDVLSVTQLKSRVRYCPMALAVAAVTVSSFTSYYGQYGKFSYADSVRISNGVFAGLRTDADQASFIEQMTIAIEEQRKCGDKLAVLGGGPGFYILTSMYPATVTVYNLAENTSKYAQDIYKNFYKNAENLPDVIVLNNWQWATPLSKFDSELVRQYVYVKTIMVSPRQASIYIRKNCN